jgi:methyl-accepting chemotaxis protein
MRLRDKLNSKAEEVNDAVNDLRKAPLWLLIVIFLGGPTIGSGVVQVVNPNIATEVRALAKKVQEMMDQQRAIQDEVHSHKEQDVAQFADILTTVNFLTRKMDETERRMRDASEEMERVIDGVRRERDHNSEYQKTMSHLVNRIDDSLSNLANAMVRPQDAGR